MHEIFTKLLSIHNGGVSFISEVLIFFRKNLLYKKSMFEREEKKTKEFRGCLRGRKRQN